MRVLDAEQPGHGTVDVAPVHRHGVEQLLDVEVEAGTVQPARLRSPERRRATCLVEQDVGVDVGVDLVALPCPDPDPDLVGHRARGDEDGCLAPAQLGGPALEGVDRLVLAVDVVADGRLRHGLAHRGRRAGDGVGAQVDRHGR